MATLRLISGNTIILIEDRSAKDTNPVAGAVTYNDSYGDLSFASVLVSTGVTYPVIGEIDYPLLHLDTAEVSGAGTLDICFSEVGFGPAGLKPFQSGIGGIAGDSVDGLTYVDGTNALFGTSTVLSTFGSYTGSFSGTDTTFFDPTEPYSLTTKATITHTSAAQVTSLNLQAAVVPEPLSSTLLLSAVQRLDSGVSEGSLKNKRLGFALQAELMLALLFYCAARLDATYILRTGHIIPSAKI